MEQRQLETETDLPRLLAASLCAVALITSLISSAFAQGRGAASNNSEIPAEIAIRNLEIQRVIERSGGYFQSAEVNFKDGNFDKARREYDRAIDIVLESGLDVRSDSRLLQHYQGLVDQIFQRQMTLLSFAATPTMQAVSNRDNRQEIQQQNLLAQSQQDKAGSDRGFGQQVYTPSPLDDLSKLKLTEEETQGVTEEQAKSAVAAAKLDFSFKPNALIQGFINYYTGRGRATMEQGLRRSGRFMGMALKIFKEEGVPQDMVWLGQVESAWSPIARSWAAAVGLWQFIPGTGARYGLRQDYYVDERSSFEKATRASARYLKWLAARYDGNWELAMAAYNSGEGRVDSAVARSGYADFWYIYDRGLLPNETRNYVPNILATIIIAKNPERYGFSVRPEPALTYDYVKVNNMVDLRLVSDATDTPYDYLLALNPELKRGLTPPGSEHLLRVPTGKGRVLHTALMRIPAEKRSSWRMLTAQNNDTFETISRKTGVSTATIEQVNGGVIRPGQKVVIPMSSSIKNIVFSSARDTMATSAPATSKGSAKMIAYKVRPGETLGDIAGRYNTSVRDIATLNRISPSARLRAGQVIKVPIRSGR
ncbi:MAG: LysM peptidoglycan-binding domain-containing protein [Acidobacteria bacterium]|nr:LysM peptidoglycan-binding domain-containing protein [Acidobacteriota bacterium]